MQAGLALIPIAEIIPVTIDPLLISAHRREREMVAQDQSEFHDLAPILLFGGFKKHPLRRRPVRGTVQIVGRPSPRRVKRQQMQMPIRRYPFFSATRSNTVLMPLLA